MKNRVVWGLTGLLLLGVGACQPDRKEAPAAGEQLFTTMPADYTGIDFVNTLTYDKDFNIYTYRNFYNGGGVALGDVNKDGLIDLYFTGNMTANRLYLNRGDFRFEDVTEAAGVGGNRGWSTGVSMADVNGDGWLDIYVCNSGNVKGDNKENELFISNGIDSDGRLTFTERATEYGLADTGYSTHAAFFDYDRDGDLDLYLLNNSYQAIGSFNLRKNVRPVRDAKGGDKLFENTSPPQPPQRGGGFVDVSAEAGIYGSLIGFGLGVTVGDINQDGWPDIYVSNDFFERDYLYLNNGRGADGKVTFREVLEQGMRSISAASMGADLADINNDRLPDLFVTDMLPGTEQRFKTKTTFDNWDRYRYSLENDYWHQFTRNMLQLNNGNGTFSEIGRLAGVEATDWSWGALIFDMDNDGFKDIFVANGIYQDLTDQDYIQFISHEETMKSIISRNGVDYRKLIDSIPVEPIPNYAFHNNGDLTFADRAAEWGLAQPSHSNGSAFGDLDNDGDLDLVVNNVNMPPFLYRNEVNARIPENHYLRLELEGEDKNTFALGARLTIRHEGRVFYLEQMPMRGFQSTMDPRPLFGLGPIGQVDTLLVEWPDGTITLRTKVATDQTLRLSQKEGVTSGPVASAPRPVFRDVSQTVAIPYAHKENRFVDFDRDRLIYHMLSTEGPRVAVGDVNGDGRSDLFLGGAKDQPGKLLIQLADGAFRSASEAAFAADEASEDTDALFFDADGDRDLDLYVCSGGNEFPASSSALIDRLYVNDGRGNFTRSAQILPTANFEPSSSVDAADVDGDGDLDLFVGGRLRPFLYGVPVNGYILLNDGKGFFQDATSRIAPALLKSGMITDGRWLDYDGDGDADLVVVGEYTPVRIFRNDRGMLTETTEPAGLAAQKGWWNRVVPADLNGDGRLDLVLGNHGRNSRFHADGQHPVRLYVNDFDQNGTAEHLLTRYEGDTAYPMVLKHDLIGQIPQLKKKYLRYESFAGKTITDIFTPEQLKPAVALEADFLETAVALNNGDGTFRLQALPVEAQFAPVYAILVHDFNGDGKVDILLGGNLFGAKPEVGRYDASYGTVLLGDGSGQFAALPAPRSGLILQDQVRDLASLRIDNREVILVVRNDAAPQVLTVER